MTHKIHLKIKHDLAACIAKGMDPLGEVVKRAKQRGLTITAEMRANNFAPGGTLEKPSYAGPGYNGLIWYETPEWRLTDPYPDPNHLDEPNCNWDWAKPEVRDFNRRVLLEVLHNYDVDGLDINFAQNPPFFNRAEPNKVAHMTGFIKSLREECDRIGQERSKPIMLTVILWDSLYGRHHLRDDGIDVAAWAKAGLIDRIVVRRTGNTAKYVAMVRGTQCKLYAIDTTEAHTLRLTLDDQHEANAYLDGSATPIMTAKLTQAVSDQRIKWGHLHAPKTGGLDSRWESLHYTLEGAYAPAQLQFE